MMNLSQQALIKLIRYTHIILVPLLLTIASFFLILLPQKKLSQRKALIQNQLRLGSRVTTCNGIRGRVTTILQNSVILTTSSGEKIEVLRHTIVEINHE